jgi:hypothetical protein
LGQILDALNLNVSNPTDTNLLGNALYKASHPLETQIDFATLYDQPRIDQQAISTLKFSTTPRSVLSSNGANFGFEAMSSVDKNILRNALLTSPQALAMSGLLSLELLGSFLKYNLSVYLFLSSILLIFRQFNGMGSLDVYVGQFANASAVATLLEGLCEFLWAPIVANPSSFLLL